MSNEALCEMFELLGSAAETPQVLEKRVSDKLCKMFNIESRSEAKKHEWFEYFTFKDWRWLFGEERSYLDLVQGGEAVCYKYSCECQRKGLEGGNMCPTLQLALTHLRRHW